MSECLIVIPARFKSTRLPGKPLRKICSETMIRRVYRLCTMTGLDTVVATDNNKIAQECINNDMEFVMTSKDCLTGTDRVAETASKKLNYTGYINVQGDEPFVNPDDILKIAEEMTPRAFDRKTDEVFCGMCRITEKEQYYSPHVPKIVFNQDKPDHSGLLRYISRAPIPAVKEGYDWPKENAWKQVCIYGFKGWHLKQFAQQKEKTTLEFVEYIEILRFLEMGVAVRMIMIEGSPMSVDTEEDLKKADDLAIKLNPNFWRKEVS